MIRIGEWNDLVIKREKEFGVYLGCADDDREVLLPRKQIPNGAKIGEHINVFIYRDSDDRIIATVKVPYITMGKMAVLRCVGTTKIGAFMDWGLEKDILLPFKEQSGLVREGREYLVRMYMDKSDRLCVSMKVYEYLSCESPYKQGDEISGIVIEYKSEYGAFVAVDNKYAALIPGKEIHSAIYPGDKIEGRVADVREDGKLNLTLQKPAKVQTRENAEMIMNIIESYNGVLPFNDKADTTVIEKEFGISKRAFKMAVGKLLKDGFIRITENSIELITEEERKMFASKGTKKDDVIIRKKPIKHVVQDEFEEKHRFRNRTEKQNKQEIKGKVATGKMLKSGKVKFTRSDGGRRNNWQAMVAEQKAERHDFEDSGDNGDK